jgi:protein AATF/BFR2
MEDNGKLIERSQIKKDRYKIIGKPPSSLTETTDSEIYDDSAFYQSLLKDFVTQSSEAPLTEDPKTQSVLAKREKVSEITLNKRDYDSKASKDRKLKYHVHEKIVNFMEPAG